MPSLDESSSASTLRCAKIERRHLHRRGVYKAAQLWMQSRILARTAQACGKARPPPQAPPCVCQGTCGAVSERCETRQGPPRYLRSRNAIEASCAAARCASFSGRASMRRRARIEIGGKNIEAQEQLVKTRLRSRLTPRLHNAERWRWCRRSDPLRASRWMACSANMSRMAGCNVSSQR